MRGMLTNLHGVLGEAPLRLGGGGAFNVEVSEVKCLMIVDHVLNKRVHG